MVVVDGGVQVGLIGVGAGAGVVVEGEGLGVCGVVIVMQPGNVPSASEMTRIKEMTKSFMFIFFTAYYILVY